MGRARLLPDLHAREPLRGRHRRADARQDLDLDELSGSGDFAPILDWLRERIHSQGSIREGDDLMREVTGRPLGHEAFMAYLTTKYGALYGSERARRRGSRRYGAVRSFATNAACVTGMCAPHSSSTAAA